MTSWQAVAADTHTFGARAGERSVRFYKPGPRLAASFPAAPESPGCARRLLAHALRLGGCEAAFVDTATLVLSELASNAVRHVGSPFSIAATLEDSTLRLAVEDRGSPSAQATMVARPTHGLGVVDALARSWGVKAAPRGKLVWAELPRAEPPWAELPVAAAELAFASEQR